MEVIISTEFSWNFFEERPVNAIVHIEHLRCRTLSSPPFSFILARITIWKQDEYRGSRTYISKIFAGVLNRFLKFPLFIPIFRDTLWWILVLIPPGVFYPGTSHAFSPVLLGSVLTTSIQQGLLLHHTVSFSFSHLLIFFVVCHLYHVSQQHCSHFFMAEFQLLLNICNWTDFL